MGFFSDLFKSEKNWSYKELAALSASLITMSAADGVIDDTEQKMVTDALMALDDGKIKDWKQFADETTLVPAEKHLQVLKNMHTTKKKLVVGLLACVELADGDVHPMEHEFFLNMARQLGVDIKNLRK